MRTVIEKGAHYLRQKSPAILLGVSFASSITSVVLAVKATPKAMQLLEAKKAREENSENLSKKEVVQTTWKCYIPAAAFMGLSIFSGVMAHRTNMRRNAALAAALSMSEQALQTFTAKAIEKVGEKKVQNIQEAVVEDKMAKTIVREDDIIYTGEGDTLFYDDMCGRPFKHDIQKVRAVINDLNEEMLNVMTMELNDLYYSLRLPATTAGSVIGWNINDKGKIAYELVAAKTKNGLPCLALKLYNWTPEYDRYGR